MSRMGSLGRRGEQSGGRHHRFDSQAVWATDMVGRAMAVRGQRWRGCDRTPLKKQGFISEDHISGFSMK
jgi:hypothetical protein